MKLKRIGDFDKKLLSNEIKDRGIIIEGEYYIPSGYNMYEILKDMRYSDGLDQQKVKKLSDDIFDVIPGLKSVEYYDKLKEEVKCELVTSNPNNVEVLTFDKLKDLSKLDGFYKLADEHFLKIVGGDFSLLGTDSVVIEIVSVAYGVHPFYRQRAVFDTSDDINKSINIINEMCSLFRVDNLNERIEAAIYQKNEFLNFEEAIKKGEDTVLKDMLETELRDVFIQEFFDGYGSHYFNIEEMKVIESEVYDKVYEDFKLIADEKIEVSDCYKSFVLENFNNDDLEFRACKHILDVVCEEGLKP